MLPEDKNWNTSSGWTGASDGAATACGDAGVSGLYGKGAHSGFSRGPLPGRDAGLIIQWPVRKVRFSPVQELPLDSTRVGFLAAAVVMMSPRGFPKTEGLI